MEADLTPDWLEAEGGPGSDFDDDIVYRGLRAGITLQEGDVDAAIAQAWDK